MKTFYARPCDILMGRGAKVFKHEGNRHLRSVVDEVKEEYVLQNRDGKMRIGYSILKRMEKEGRRFLMKVDAKGNRIPCPSSTEGTWVLSSEHTAKNKIMQCLRENQPSFLKETLKKKGLKTKPKISYAKEKAAVEVLVKGLSVTKKNKPASKPKARKKKNSPKKKYSLSKEEVPSYTLAPAFRVRMPRSCKDKLSTSYHEEAVDEDDDTLSDTSTRNEQETPHPGSAPVATEEAKQDWDDLDAHEDMLVEPPYLLSSHSWSRGFEPIHGPLGRPKKNALDSDDEADEEESVEEEEECDFLHEASTPPTKITTIQSWVVGNAGAASTTREVLDNWMEENPVHSMLDDDLDDRAAMVTPQLVSNESWSPALLSSIVASRSKK